MRLTKRACSMYMMCAHLNNSMMWTKALINSIFILVRC